MKESSGKGNTAGRQYPSDRKTEIEKLKDQVLQLSTELKKCQEEQHISKEISEEGHISHNNFIITGSNFALAKMIGYEVPDLIGNSVAQFLTPNSFDILSGNVAQNDGEPVEIELIRRDGQIINVLYKKRSVLVDGILKHVLIIQDISKVKEAQLALQDSEEKNRALSETSSEALFFSDQGICIEANIAAYKMFGYDHGELIGMFGTDIIAEQSKKIVKQNLLSEYEHPYEVVAQRKDGSTFYAELEGQMYTYKGKAVRVTQVRDITQRKKTEDALVKSEELHRQISGLVTDFVYACKVLPGKRLFFEWGGENFAQLTGYTTEEIHGFERTWLSIVHPEDVERVIQEVDNNEWETKSRHLEYRIITKQGTTAWLNNKVIIDLDDENNIIRLLGAVHDITDRKNAESALVKSEERHRQISGMLSDFIYSFRMKPNEGSHTTWVSGAFEKICGYTLEEIVEMDKGWLSIVHPDDVDDMVDISMRELTQYGFSRYEYRIIDKQGKVRWLLDRNMRIALDESIGEITALGATKDITDRKEIEENLRNKNVEFEKLNEQLSISNDEISSINKVLKESEEKYKNLIENSPLGVGISKGEQMFFANKAFLDIYGIDSFEEFVTKKITDYLPPKTKARFKERIEKINKNIPVENKFRHEVIRSDGEIRLVDANVSDIIYEGKKCRQVILSDVTLEKKNEEALQRAANIFKNIQVGLYIYQLEDLEDDHTLRLIAANPASSLIVGIPGSELIGKNIDEVFPILRKSNIPQQYAEVIRTQIPVDVEDVYYQDDKTMPAIYSLKVFPLPNQCVGVSFENVSAKRNAENELRVRNTELNNFVYKVSHDLKAPLSSIKGLINLTKMEKNSVDHMPMIEDRINRLDGFIRDILSHSRNLNTAVIIEKLDLEDIMKYCFDELDYLPFSKSIEKTVTKSGVDFYNDKIRLAEISRNLVSNSIKYQDSYKELKYVKVSINVTPKYGTITFEDNGVGIKNEYLKNIFKMFYRATESSEGSGIGLYIVKQAVEKLGGEIKVESEYGKGAKFIIKLPNLISKKESGALIAN